MSKTQIIILHLVAYNKEYGIVIFVQGNIKISQRYQKLLFIRRVWICLFLFSRMSQLYQLMHFYYFPVTLIFTCYRYFKFTLLYYLC